MRKNKSLAAVCLAAAGIILGAACLYTDSPELFTTTISMVTTTPEVSAPAETPPAASPPTTAKPTPTPKPGPSIIPTTISGGLVIKNSTDYSIQVSELVKQGSPVKLKKGKPQILIIHTHSSEAYSPAGLDKYVDSGASRTQDNNYNVIRIGTELEKYFEKYGLNVIHDCGVYDYPSYTGSYNRSGEAVEKYLKEYPSISVVIDLHRDAIGTNDVIYKTVATESGVCASQLMFVMGTDESGLEYPNWTQNLRLALYLQNAVLEKYPSLMRPVTLVPYRYNQHLSTGSVILEVGSNGNTLQEALAAIRLFGETAGPALADLVE